MDTTRNIELARKEIDVIITRTKLEFLSFPTPPMKASNNLSLILNVAKTVQKASTNFSEAARIKKILTSHDSIKPIVSEILDTGKPPSSIALHIIGIVLHES